MRDIKFRAWDEDRHKMIKEFGLLSEKKPQLLFNEEGEMFCGWYKRNEDWQEPVLMQYTGLKDKNGKDIYEGDIINMKSYNYRHLNNEKWAVQYFPQGMMFEFKCLTFDRVTENILGFYDIEVIGNIYENPSILNTKN